MYSLHGRLQSLRYLDQLSANSSKALSSYEKISRIYIGIFVVPRVRHMANISDGPLCSIHNAPCFIFYFTSLDTQKEYAQ